MADNGYLDEATSWLTNPIGKSAETRTTGIGKREISVEKLEANLQNIRTGDFDRMWQGGFLGMSEKGIETLKTALKKFITDLQIIADSFNEEGSIEMAFKGTVKDAVQDYIKSIKELIKAYITIINNGIHDADSAFANWKEQNTAISQNIGEHSQSVRDQATKIQVD